MLKVIILICPLAVDHQHCTRDTAIDVISARHVSSPGQCIFLGQAMLARTTLVPDASKQYVKIICEGAPAAAIERAPLGRTVAVRN